MNRTRADVPAEIMALHDHPGFRRHQGLPTTRPVVPFVQTPHDRIAIEIMRGLPLAMPFLPIDGSSKRPFAHSVG